MSLSGCFSNTWQLVTSQWPCSSFSGNFLCIIYVQCQLCSLTLNLGLKHVFCRVFVVADIHTPIIGAGENGLMVNMKHGRLDMTTNLQSQSTISHVVSLCPSLHQQQHSVEYDTILADFPEPTATTMITMGFTKF